LLNITFARGCGKVNNIIFTYLMDLRESRSRNVEAAVRHPWELARLEVVYRLLSRRIGKNKIGNILDLGCGDTYFVEQFAGRFPGRDFAAVDIAFDKETRLAYEERLKGKPIHLFDSLEEAQSGFKTEVDLVLLLDVIEHIEHDIDFLSSLKNYSFIKKDAWVIITVPAYQSLFCSHDKFLGHYRRYTNKMLEEHVKKAGYIPREAGYFFSSLLLPRYLQVRKEKSSGYRKETTGLVEWSGSPSKTALLKNILLFDFEMSRAAGLFGFNVPGLSNYMLCQRSV
jgi:hypothetical protein